MENDDLELRKYAVACALNAFEQVGTAIDLMKTARDIYEFFSGGSKPDQEKSNEASQGGA